MRYTLRTKRVLVGTAAGAMVLGLLPGAALADRAAVCANAEEGVFNDVPSSNVHSTNIDCVAAYGITSGIGDGSNYGPRDDVRRDQMATFLVRLGNAALAGEFDVAADSPFTDIAGNTHESNIKTAFAEEITTGTQTPGIYAPRAFVTRAQMATFVASAIDAVGGELPDGDGGFTDTSGNVHENNINRLAAAGVIVGRPGGTTYDPNANVTRDQMATFLANAAGLLDTQGEWNAPRLPGPSVELYSITDGFAVTNAPATDFVWASDGESVSAFEATAGSSFVVDGTASTRAAFDQNLTVADELVVTEDGNNFVFELTNVDATEILSGVIELDLDDVDTAFAFIDPASGVALNTVSTDIALGQTYTVDGTTASQTRFENNISTGDVLVAEVLETDAAGDPTAFRHNLTNAAIDGEIVFAEDAPAVDGDVVVLDTNPDDIYSPELDADFASPDFAGVDLDIDAGDNNVFIVDGEEVDFSDGDDGFDVTVVEGAALTYSRAASVATYSITTVAPEPIEAVTGVVLFGNDTDGAVDDLNDISLLVDVDEDLVEISVADTVRVVIDGLASTRGELLSNISVGDTITYQKADPDYDVAESVNLTNGTITGARVIGKNADATQLLVQLANGYEIPDVNPLSNPYGVVGDADFTINGAATFTADDGSTVAAKDIALDVLVRTNLVTNNVGLSLDEGDADKFTWQITGIPASVLNQSVNNA